MKRIVLFMLTLLISIGTAAAALPQSALAKSEKVTVIAGSDFQAATAADGADNVKRIISSMKSDGHTKIDGFLFGGDYSTDYESMDDEIATLRSAVKSEYKISDSDMVFVQGNHDPATSKGLSKSGANDSEHYGVFVIHEDDYMWYNNNLTKIKSTAASLEAYLKEKAESGYTKPIFVTSHLALNYSRRTYNDGDGMYARYLFDVLNEYGQSLNIIFLFGHNHNNRYDDHIGGSQVFLTRGDTIFISQIGKKTAKPDAFTLNFTYLNYGYVSAAYNLNNNISMTVFEIENDIVKISRYGELGEIALKTKGQWASSLEENANFYNTTDNYLSLYYDESEYISPCGADNGVTVVSSQIAKINVTSSAAPTEPKLQTAFVGYDIEYTGKVKGANAIITIKLPEGFNADEPIFVRDKEEDKTFALFAKNGKIRFTAENASSYELYQTKGKEIDSEKREIFKPTTQFVDGKNMMIVSKNTAGEAFALQNKSGTELTAAKVEIKNGNGGAFIETDDKSLKWLFIHDVDFGYANEIGDLKCLKTNKYLVALGGTELSTTDDTEAQFTAWRNAASTSFGVYTLPNKSTYTRWYIKYKDGFTVSDSEETATRVYLFVGEITEIARFVYTSTAIGKVGTSADANTPVGAKIFVATSDGKITETEATLSMLRDKDGNEIDTTENATLNNLSLVYNGVTVSNSFSLTIGEGGAIEDEPTENESSDEPTENESSEVTDESEVSDEISESVSEDILSSSSPAESVDEASDSSEAVAEGDGTSFYWIYIGIAIAVIVIAAAVLVLKKVKK